MNDKQLQNTQRRLEFQIREVGVRIRRYTLDKRLTDQALLDKLNSSHAAWLKLRKEFLDDLPATLGRINEIENALLEIDRGVDIVQRELVSVDSFKTGSRTVILLALALVVLVAIYLFSHGIKGWNVEEFEPWAEWGPLKYLEVAFWSEFGVLCYLLFLAGYYIQRRDFDEWYQSWYLSTALRAPFLTVILMILVLEFVEWYGEDSWIHAYLLEDGNKFYFIVFMSFCLGLVSDRASDVMRELAESVLDFVHGVVKRVSSKLRTAIDPDRGIPK